MPGYLVPAQQSTNPFTPTGNISSTTVGDAIVELDNEKAPTTGIAQSSITNLVSDLSAKAPLVSPTFTGTVTTANITMSGLTTLSETTEVFNSGTISANVFTADANGGNVFYITSAPLANFTINITNLPTTDSRIFSFSFFVIQGATGYIPNALQIGGVSQTLKWAAGVAPTPTSGAGKVDVFNITIIRRSSTWEALGDVSKNY